MRERGGKGTRGKGVAYAVEPVPLGSLGTVKPLLGQKVAPAKAQVPLRNRFAALSADEGLGGVAVAHPCGEQVGPRDAEGHGCFPGPEAACPKPLLPAERLVRRGTSRVFPHY